jgi:phage nucleotide-binding protein
MKVMNTKDSPAQKVKALIAAPSGAGKTTLAKTLTGKTILISAEAGLLCLKGADIDYVDISTNDKGDVLKTSAERIGRLVEVFNWLHAGTEYKNVFVDGLTEISELLVDELNRQFPDRKDTFPMWGEYAKRMRGVIKNFRDLPYNVFITVVTEVDKDENNKRFMGFQVAGSISKKLPQYFDEVFYIHVDADKKRSIITLGSDTIIAKDRSNKLLPVEECDLAMIMAKINKKEKEKE